MPTFTNPRIGFEHVAQVAQRQSQVLQPRRREVVALAAMEQVTEAPASPEAWRRSWPRQVAAAYVEVKWVGPFVSWYLKLVLESRFGEKSTMFMWSGKMWGESPL